MKTHTTTVNFFILFILILWGCSKDDDTKDSCIKPCNTSISNHSPFSKNDIVAEGEITESSTGYYIDGKLTIDTDSTGQIIFDNAKLDVTFNDDGTLATVTGTTEVPPPSNYFTFEDPIQSDVGFYSGKHLNENHDFEIRLVDERFYFLFNIAVNIEIKIGANNDPNAHKPLSLKPPVGGHITYIADYTDPMYFFSASQDVLGSGSIGISQQGFLSFEPTQPVDDILSFSAKSVRGGSFSFWKILEANGMYYENKELSADVQFDAPMQSDIGYNYRSGINGELELSLPIQSFVAFGFPIGQGSAAVIAEASAQNGVTAKAFINGLVDPDTSWWPDLIPLKPDGQLRAYGYIVEGGNFDIGLSGSFGIQMPEKTQKVTGALQLTEDVFTMTGKVTRNEEVWGANATFTKNETEYIATPPDNFSDNVGAIVDSKIDSTFAAVEKALEDLKEATKNYEFELSLRGLREVLPRIVSTALSVIDNSVTAGIADGRSQADTYLSQYGRVLCNDNIVSVVNDVVVPYKNALNQLKNAVNESNDNDQTRMQLEAALRNLATLHTIDKRVNVSITHGNKEVRVLGEIVVPKCTTTARITRSIAIKATVLNSGQVNQLLEAADNVKYIQQASDMMINAQRVLDELPSFEDIQHLKNNILDCVNQISENIGDLGFIKNHTTNEYTYFMEINGERTQVSDFDIFDSSSVIDIAMPEFNQCNADSALERLVNTTH